jgi:hypothetical protein
MLLVFSIAFTSCETEADLKESTYNYSFHTAYAGTHGALSAKMTLNEMSDGTTKITVELDGTENGDKYIMHAHDADTAAVGGYDTAPNMTVLATDVTATGTTATVEFTSTMSYEALTTSYDGFYVIHDSKQAVNPSDPTTFLVLGAFAR